MVEVDAIFRYSKVPYQLILRVHNITWTFLTIAYKIDNVLHYEISDYNSWEDNDFRTWLVSSSDG